MTNLQLSQIEELRLILDCIFDTALLSLAIYGVDIKLPDCRLLYLVLEIEPLFIVLAAKTILNNMRPDFLDIDYVLLPL